MKLIIFGPPGSGKGTYSRGLKEKIGIEKISTGDILRAEIKSGSEIGKKFANYVKDGKLVPDEIVNEIVRKKISEINDNFILDGYPRTIGQANFLLNLTKIDAIININVHDEILVEKISARRICSNPNCDGNYNIADIRKKIDGIEYFLPPLLPKNDMKCDKCGSDLIQRSDDKPEIIKKRIEIYYEQTKPVLEFLKSKNIPIVDVWMCKPPEQVVDEIIDKLKNLNLL